MAARSVQTIAEEGYHLLQDHVTTAAGTTAKTLVGAIQAIDERAKEVNWTQILGDTVDVVKNNPRAVMIPAAVAAGAVTGGLLTGPALAAAGFSSIGPVAGSAAASFQSAFGVGAVFSTLQSAAMGGSGMASVSSAFSAAGAAAGWGLVGRATDKAADSSSSAANDENEAEDKGRTTDGNSPEDEGERVEVLPKTLAKL